jgi:CheY-like chemotaxis protein
MARALRLALTRAMNARTQAEQSTMRVFGGTGLGLTESAQCMCCVYARAHVKLTWCGARRFRRSRQICKRIAGAMGGSLVAQSEGLGKGVTMVFTIPLGAELKRSSSVVVVDNVWDEKPSALLRRMSAPHEGSDRSRSPSVASPPDSPAASFSSAPAADAGALSSQGGSVVQQSAAAPAPQQDAAAEEGDARLRVLIAEDDRLCQTLMRKLMPKMGFMASLVDNGAEAIEACCNCGPDGGAFVLGGFSIFCLRCRRWISDTRARACMPQLARLTLC